MNKSLIKFITDFGPLVIFFYFYYNSGKDLQVAIPPLIVATIISILIVWFFEKKIPMVPLIGGILITLFGGLTIYFNNPIFIYMKPTIINILFGLSLFFGKYFTKEPLLKLILGKSLPLNDEGWNILNFRWIWFFFALAILNEVIWRTQTEEFWVNFKVWGMLPITFIFTAFQIPIIKKYEEKFFFEKSELKIILDLYAKMVSNGSWKDYGLNISNKQVSFSVFKNAAENAIYNICKNFKPNSKNLKYCITDSRGRILKNSHDLENLINKINWKKL